MKPIKIYNFFQPGLFYVIRILKLCSIDFQHFISSSYFNIDRLIRPQADVFLELFPPPGISSLWLAPIQYDIPFRNGEIFLHFQDVTWSSRENAIHGCKDGLL
jgi:hypothetical protein